MKSFISESSRTVHLASRISTFRLDTFHHSTFITTTRITTPYHHGFRPTPALCPLKCAQTTAFNRLSCPIIPQLPRQSFFQDKIARLFPGQVTKWVSIHFSSHLYEAVPSRSSSSKYSKPEGTTSLRWRCRRSNSYCHKFHLQSGNARRWRYAYLRTGISE